ncbi:MAG: hypothetical protein IKJ75_05630 [Clostridia bacterium]|nr:hypothetical protein [Clostridia bacterium]
MREFGVAQHSIFLVAGDRKGSGNLCATAPFALVGPKATPGSAGGRKIASSEK